MNQKYIKYSILLVLFFAFSCDRNEKNEVSSEEWLCIKYDSFIWRAMRSKHGKYSKLTGSIAGMDQQISKSVTIYVPAKDYDDLVSLCKREEPIPSIILIDRTSDMKFAMTVGKYKKDFAVSMCALESLGNDTPDENKETIKCARRCFEVFSQLTGKNGESEFLPPEEEGWY